MRSHDKKTEISIVIPIYNEADNIHDLYLNLRGIMDKVSKDYEIIFVDDNSQDGTLEVLRQIFDRDKHIQVVSLLGNHGQALALVAGFRNAKGDIILAMDGDGQHDPAYIPEFISVIEEGYDIASGWKQKSRESARFHFFLSNIAHRLISRITSIKMKYFGATMKAYRREILEHLDLSGDLHRFIGALVYYKGIKIKEIPIKIRAREKGKSSYSISKIFKVILDLILIKFLTKYAKTPFRIFGAFGALLSIIGSIGLLYVFGSKYFIGHSTLSNASILIIAYICIIVGIQCVLFGLMAEMISRVYYNQRESLLYSIKSHLKH